MQVEDLIIEVRNSELKRVGQLKPSDLIGFTAVLRFNAPGTWKAILPVGNRMAELLKLPGSGIIVSNAQGVLMSGPMIEVKQNLSIEDPRGTYEISGVDDSILLAERLAYPSPDIEDVNAQTDAYDTRTGDAETVIKDYVSANAGPDAVASRQNAQLTIEPSYGRGAVVTGNARFDKLQDLLKALADLSDLGFTIEQDADALEFKVYEPVDRSAYIRLDLDNGRLKSTEYSYSQPKATRVIVGGSGELEARSFLEQTSSEATEAETAWGRRVEVFLDQRQTADPDELSQAANEILVADGKTIISVNIAPSDDQSMLFGIDWNLGDQVTCVVGATEIQAVVTEVGLMISADGVRIGATVGEPRSLDYETQILTKQADAALRISKLERTK